MAGPRESEMHSRAGSPASRRMLVSRSSSITACGYRLRHHAVGHQVMSVQRVRFGARIARTITALVQWRGFGAPRVAIHREGHSHSPRVARSPIARAPDHDVGRLVGRVRCCPIRSESTDAGAALPRSHEHARFAEPLDVDLARAAVVRIRRRDRSCAPACSSSCRHAGGI
jgi:hypothetical protein